MAPLMFDLRADRSMSSLAPQNVLLKCSGEAQRRRPSISPSCPPNEFCFRRPSRPSSAAPATLLSTTTRNAAAYACFRHAQRMPWDAATYNDGRPGITIIASDGEVSAAHDRLIKQSITEIMKNLGESPLLVHIYEEDGNGTGVLSSDTCGGGVRLVMEKATAVEWPLIRWRWDSGSRSAPSAIVLVEELNDNRDDKCNDRDSRSGTKMWGLLIQGRRQVDGGGSSCYLLKTCRERSWTHFCLAKASCCPGESAEVQMRKAWVQAAQGS